MFSVSSSSSASSSSSSSSSAIITFEKLGFAMPIQNALVQQGITEAFLSTLTLQEYNAFIREKSVFPFMIARRLGLTSDQLSEHASQTLRNFILSKGSNSLSTNSSLKPSDTLEAFCATHFSGERGTQLFSSLKLYRADFSMLLKFENSNEFSDSGYLFGLRLEEKITLWRAIEIERTLQPAARLEVQPVAIPESKGESKGEATAETTLVKFFNRYNLFPTLAATLASALNRDDVTYDDLLRSDLTKLNAMMSKLKKAMAPDNFINLHFALRAERKLNPVPEKTPTDSPSTDLADFANKRFPRKWFKTYLPLINSKGITLDLCLKLASLGVEELSAIPSVDSPLKGVLLYDALSDELRVREGLPAVDKRKEEKEERIEKVKPHPEFNQGDEAQKLRDFITYYQLSSLMHYASIFASNKITLQLLLNINNYAEMPTLLKNGLGDGHRANLWVAIRQEQAHRRAVEAIDMLYFEEAELATYPTVVKVLGEYMGFFGEINARDLKASKDRGYVNIPGGVPVKKTVEVLNPVTSVDDFFKRYPSAMPLSHFLKYIKESQSLHYLMGLSTYNSSSYKIFSIDTGTQLALKDAIAAENKVIDNHKLHLARESAVATPPGGATIR
jgi:hypothetical protein